MSRRSPRFRVSTSFTSAATICSPTWAKQDNSTIPTSSQPRPISDFCPQPRGSGRARYAGPSARYDAPPLPFLIFRGPSMSYFKTDKSTASSARAWIDRWHRGGAMSPVLSGLIVLAVMLTAGVPAQAGYPERTITIICASGAGGAVDVTTRVVAEQLSRILGKPIVVQNEPGAGSTIAIASASKAEADGYTLLTVGSGVAVARELYPQA